MHSVSASGSNLDGLPQGRREERVHRADPESWEVTGAVLLTDIDGFTGIVEREGVTRDGLEALSREFNAYFSRIVEVVHARGGEILSIAGDGFLCIWTATEFNDVANAVTQAAAAALEICRGDESTEGTSRIRFPTRAVIAAGEVDLALVGGVGGVWEKLAIGTPVQQVIEAARRTNGGDVNLCDSAWRWISTLAEGTSLSDGLVRIDRMIVADTDVGPPASQHRRPKIHPTWPEGELRPSAPDWSSEIRRVTVLYTRLAEISDVSAKGLYWIHDRVQHVQTVADRLEGGLWLRIDDKGVVALMVFSLPGKAHGNDGERAILAATAIQPEIVAHGGGLGIGIATGPAFCGTFGNERKREYTIHGDVINLAAALAQATPRDILCHHATAELVRGRYTFEVLPSIAVKGRPQSIPVYRPKERATGIRATETRFVGRTAERLILSSKLLQARSDGGAHLVIVEGEPGIGKSRVMSELATEAAAAGFQILSGASDAIERSTPLYAWRSVFAVLFELQPDMDAETIASSILHGYADIPELRELLPLLSPILPSTIEDTARTIDMAAPTRAENTRRLLKGVLQAAVRRQPTILIIEDVHWLDTASLMLLREVVGSVTPLLTVVTARPGTEALHPVGTPSIKRIQLEGLNLDEMRSFIAEFLGIVVVPNELLEFIQERVAGNPFFCEELIRAMRESGAIRVVGDRCLVGQLGSKEHPTSIEAAILSRLDRLEQREQLCLKVASVIGRDFLARTIGEIFPIAEQRAQIPESLEILSRLDLIRLRSDVAGGAYSFKHVITRDVTYGLMPLSLRQPLHRAVAEWYESRYEDDITSHLPLLSHHWDAAGEPAKAVHYLGRAGDQALLRGAYRETVQLLSQAIRAREGQRIDIPLAEQASWEKTLARAHFYLGDMSRSRYHLGRTVALLHHPVPETLGQARRAVLREVISQFLHRLAPQRYVGRRAADRDALDQAVDSYKILGQIYYLDGEPPALLAYPTLAGLNLGEEAGPSPELACIMINTAVMVSVMGLRRLGDRYARRAIQMVDLGAQRSAAAYVWHIYGVMLAQRGAWNQALEANERALTLIQEFGDYTLEAEAWLVRSTIHRFAGKFTEAVSVWSRGRELARASGNTQFECWTYLDEVQTRLAVGDVAGAGRALEYALAIPTAPGDGSSTVGKQWALSITRLAEGRVRESIEAASTIIDTVCRQRPTGYHAVEYAAEAVEVLLRALDTTDDYVERNRRSIERRAARGARRLRRLSWSFVHVQPRALRIEGTILFRKGRTDAARRSWTKAERIARKRGMEIERARALAELCRTHTSPDPTQHLGIATEILALYGAEDELKRLQQAIHTE